MRIITDTASPNNKIEHTEYKILCINLSYQYNIEYISYHAVIEVFYKYKKMSS